MFDQVNFPRAKEIFKRPETSKKILNYDEKITKLNRDQKISPNDRRNP